MAIITEQLSGKIDVSKAGDYAVFNCLNLTVCGIAVVPSDDAAGSWIITIEKFITIDIFCA